MKYQLHSRPGRREDKDAVLRRGHIDFLRTQSAEPEFKGRPVNGTIKDGARWSEVFSYVDGVLVSYDLKEHAQAGKTTWNQLLGAPADAGH